VKRYIKTYTFRPIIFIRLYNYIAQYGDFETPLFWRMYFYTVDFIMKPKVVVFKTNISLTSDCLLKFGFPHSLTCRLGIMVGGPFCIGSISKGRLQPSTVANADLIYCNDMLPKVEVAYI